MPLVPTALLNKFAVPVPIPPSISRVEVSSRDGSSGWVSSLDSVLRDCVFGDDRSQDKNHFFRGCFDGGAYE